MCYIHVTLACYFQQVSLLTIHCYVRDHVRAKHMVLKQDRQAPVPVESAFQLWIKTNAGDYNLVLFQGAITNTTYSVA